MCCDKVTDEPDDAAIFDENGYLEVKAFQNNCKEVGHVHTDIPVPIGAPITAVTAADLDSSQIVTAVVDQNGTLQLLSGNG